MYKGEYKLIIVFDIFKRKNISIPATAIIGIDNALSHYIVKHVDYLKYELNKISNNSYLKEIIDNKLVFDETTI